LTKNLRVKKKKDAQPEVLKRADAMTNRDDRNINLDYTKKMQRIEQPDLAEQEAVKCMGL
jgi:hypothetical protein